MDGDARSGAPPPKLEAPDLPGVGGDEVRVPELSGFVEGHALGNGSTPAILSSLRLLRLPLWLTPRQPNFRHWYMRILLLPSALAEATLIATD